MYGDPEFKNLWFAKDRVDEQSVCVLACVRDCAAKYEG